MKSVGPGLVLAAKGKRDPEVERGTQNAEIRRPIAWGTPVYRSKEGGSCSIGNMKLPQKENADPLVDDYNEREGGGVRKR